MNAWIETALALGFTHAAVLDAATLCPRQDIRQMCAADRCSAYAKNWSCPPYCGTLEECRARLRGFSRGILVQTVAVTQKIVDTKAYRETELQHLDRFYRLADQIRTLHPEALCLGSGGCRICGRCAWPSPCRFPQRACSSMEAYGLFVTQVCRDNGVAYYYGEKTICYTACILWEPTKVSPSP